MTNSSPADKPPLIRIDPADTVAVALREIAPGEECALDGRRLTARERIPFGHKIALRDVAPGENVIKYGMPIGHAKCAIPVGSRVHTHNLATNLSGQLQYEYAPAPVQQLPHSRETFMGYVRPDGRVGVRNEIWIIPTVGCVNTTAKRLEAQANSEMSGRCDGVFAYTHNMGCSQLGDDLRRTQKLLAGLAHNPNAAGVLVLSLGCENNNLDAFKPYLADMDPASVRYLVTQDVEDEYEAAMKLLDELTEYAAKFTREPVPVSKLVVGFKCGGSDAFSGITANPLCGLASDIICGSGGTTMITEVPEMFGAETLLMARAQDMPAFESIVKLINGFKAYFESYHQVIYENPSPGNKDGGITTLEEKSLGCTQKGGHAPVTGVLDYGEQAKTPGLLLLNGPGNDQVSCTSLAASGAQIIVFTTGRGNPFGTPVPTVKVATNTPLATRKHNWIDFNAGTVVDGTPLPVLAEEFFAYILEVASGKRTYNEQFGYKEISVFRDGIIE